MGTDKAGTAAGAAAEAAASMAFNVPSGVIWDTPENFDRVFGKPAVEPGALATGASKTGLRL
jgi:hypothetical protein